MKKLLDIVYDVETNCCLDMYLPDGDGFSTVVYFHGGGIVSGDKAEANYTEIAEKFAANGYAFLSVNYRMYPDAKFPDYLYDAATGLSIPPEISNKPFPAVPTGIPFAPSIYSPKTRAVPPSRTSTQTVLSGL